jgi:MFS family permease
LQVFGFGGILGPLIGGTLSMPADNIPFFKGNAFFERFPFFLPSLVIVIITIIDLVFAVFYLKESKVWTREDEERKLALTPVSSRSCLRRGKQTFIQPFYIYFLTPCVAVFNAG